MQMNRKSSLAICLSAVVLVALTCLVVSHHSKAGHLVAALSGGRSGQRAIRAASRPATGQDFLFDPVLVYSSLLGGPSTSLNIAPGHAQFVNVIFVDSMGNLYLTGGTNSPSFPTTPGVVQPTQGSSASFLAKVDPTGQHLVFATYVPGFDDGISAMTVDASGNIYVAGGSNPAVLGAPVLPIPSGSNPYRSTGSIGILELNPNATSVLSATYLGGSSGDTVGGIALDSSGNVYVTGSTSSNDYPTSPSPLQPSLGTSGHSVFVTVLNSNLSNAVYSTYLGANRFRKYWRRP